MFRNKANGNPKIVGDRGFTLIEVLIAMAIFSIGILGVAGMQVSAINGNGTARRSTEACAWATDQIEKLMSLPYGDAELDSAGNPHQVVQGVYTIQWNVTDNTAPGGTPNTKNINVTVTSRGRTLSVDFVKARDV
jgi:prepilin-type N-terminal cleavage/methylation domain-containing protein